VADLSHLPLLAIARANRPGETLKLPSPHTAFISPDARAPDRRYHASGMMISRRPMFLLHASESRVPLLALHASCFWQQCFSRRMQVVSAHL
jgi:hypothetical protein